MFRKYAPEFLRHGLSIIPAKRDKRPGIPTWTPFQKRKATPEEIAAWSKNLGDLNIAIVCGKVSNLTILDCDSAAAVEKVESILPDSLEVPSVKTPRGGKHYYFKYCPQLRCRNAADKNLDIKSEGGYALAPPSKTDKGIYTWNSSLGLDSISIRPDVPLELVKYFQDRKKGSHSEIQTESAFPLTEGRRDDDLFHLALQFFKDGHSPQEVERIVLRVARVCTPPFSDKDALAKVKSAYKRFSKRELAAEEVKLVERNSAAVRMRPIPWLWHGVMPTHMATAITGDAGEGKSLVAIDIAARVSRGIAFPIYGKPLPPVTGHVFYITSEGVPEMILVPRLLAAGADLTKVTIIEGVFVRNGEFSIFDITQHLPQVEQRAKDFPDLKLLIIDPIASFLPERINPNQANSVRQAMDKVSTLAYKLGVAAPTVMHFNKPTGTGGRGIHRTAGSVQFGAAVKMSWSVVRRQGDPKNTRLLVPQKSNITGAQKSLAFTIHEVQFPVPENPTETIDTVKIEFGNLVDDDPEKLISPIANGPNNHVTKACEFLQRKLAEGRTLYAKPLIDEAEEEGIPKWALYKAKDRLGVGHDKEDRFQGRTFWFQA